MIPPRSLPLQYLQHKYVARLLLLTGVGFCLTPYASAAVALLLGVLVALLSGNPYAQHTKLYAQKCLAYSIVGLGAGMNLVSVGAAGLVGFAITFVSIALTLGLCLALGRLVKADRETSMLIAVGTAICGGSAIAAVAPVMRAKPQSISVALGTVFILNAVALFIFPAIGHYAELSEQQFGLWSALAIHDTSSVVGATLRYGPDALREGVLIKLARALWIIPLTFGFAFAYRDHGEAGPVKVKKPWFILGFVAMAAAVTWVPAMQTVGPMIEQAARHLLVATLFLIGANLTLETLKSVGIRPFLQGLLSWLLVASISLVVVRIWS